MKKLTQKELKRLLEYCPETGVFRWIVAKMYKIKIGDVAGHANKDGYRKITINGKIYLASRLAYLYMEGYFPENDIDHINRNTSNDAWENLRHVSHACNMRNQKTRSTNTSGVTGVSLDKVENKWHAQIMIVGKPKKLGRFTNFIDAVKSRWEAEKEYGWPNCNTTSSAYSYLQKHSHI